VPTPGPGGTKAGGPPGREACFHQRGVRAGAGHPG
jgi:hypothetical protein